MSPFKHRIQSYKAIRKSYDQMCEEVNAEERVSAQHMAYYDEDVDMDGDEEGTNDQVDDDWEEIDDREKEGLDKEAIGEGMTRDDDEEEEGATHDEEEKEDAVLSETFALSDLLQIEQEQPDDLLPDSTATFDQSERLDTSNAPSTRRRRNSRWDMRPLSSPRSPLSYDHEYDDPAPSAFVETEVAITRAEWTLSFLPPFCNHRARLPSPLRFCCTIIWEE